MTVAKFVQIQFIAGLSSDAVFLHKEHKVFEVGSFILPLRACSRKDIDLLAIPDLTNRGIPTLLMYVNEDARALVQANGLLNL